MHSPNTSGPNHGSDSDLYGDFEDVDNEENGMDDHPAEDPDKVAAVALSALPKSLAKSSDPVTKQAAAAIAAAEADMSREKALEAKRLAKRKFDEAFDTLGAKGVDGDEEEAAAAGNVRKT